MIGCLGRAESTEITIDSGEIADARWFSLEDARLMLDKRHPEGFNVPGRHAIANVLIASFVTSA
jgi:NAD+ diphosphatase